MPKPKPDQTKEEFLSECMSIAVGEEGMDSDQAFAYCNAIWEEERERISSVTRQEEDPFWFWDEASQRYRDPSGRFISRTRVRELALQSIRSSVDVLDPLATFFSEGDITAADWRSVFGQEVKDEFIRQYIAGIGGRENMTPADYGRVGRMLRDQYAFMDSFTEDLPNLSEAAIRARMNQYMAASNQAFERAKAQSALKWGGDENFWEINPFLENCETCIDRNSFGWQTVGPNGGYVDRTGTEAFPADGQSICIANCACFLKYRNSASGEEFKG